MEFQGRFSRLKWRPMEFRGFPGRFRGVPGTFQGVPWSFRVLQWVTGAFKSIPELFKGFQGRCSDVSSGFRRLYGCPRGFLRRSRVVQSISESFRSIIWPWGLQRISEASREFQRFSMGFRESQERFRGRSMGFQGRCSVFQRVFTGF